MCVTGYMKCLIFVSVVAFNMMQPLVEVFGFLFSFVVFNRLFVLKCLNFVFVFAFQEFDFFFVSVVCCVSFISLFLFLFRIHVLFGGEGNCKWFLRRSEARSWRWHRVEGKEYGLGKNKKNTKKLF